MKKIIALMCAALFLFGGTYAMASTSISEPQTFEKKKDKTKKVEKADTKTENKNSKTNKNDKKNDKDKSKEADKSKK